MIVVSGELDLASSPALEAELDRVFGSDEPVVILDLRQLDFMDSTGLSVLIESASDGGERLIGACGW